MALTNMRYTIYISTNLLLTVKGLANLVTILMSFSTLPIL